MQNFLKDSLTILKAVHATSHDETPIGYPWFFFLLILLAVACSFGGLLLLTACMKRYDATFSSAMFVGSFVVSASIMSAVHYDTFQHLQSAFNFIMYPAGLVVLMGGVYMLIQESKEDDNNINNRGDFVVDDDLSRSPLTGEHGLVAIESVCLTKRSDDQCCCAW